MTAEVSRTATLPDATAIGRVAIRAADLDALLPFYRDAVGFAVERDGSTAHLSVGDGAERLRLVEDRGLAPRPAAAAGLFHVAIRLPDRPSLGDALARLRDAGATLDGASDHLVSEALYLTDPAGNGLELYRDRPRDSWTRPRPGMVEMDTLPLDLGDLAAAGTGATRGGLPADTDVGHVHLEVTDLEASTAFYRDGLGFAITTDSYAGARFLAAGGYHHHVGLNVWNGRSRAVGDHQGLDWFEVVLPATTARTAAVDRLTERGHEVTERDGDLVVVDPDGIRVRLTVRPAAERS